MYQGHGANGTQSLLRSSGTERGGIARCLQVVPCDGMGVGGGLPLGNATALRFDALRQGLGATLYFH